VIELAIDEARKLGHATSAPSTCCSDRARSGAIPWRPQSLGVSLEQSVIGDRDARPAGHGARVRATASRRFHRRRPSHAHDRLDDSSSAPSRAPTGKPARERGKEHAAPSAPRPRSDDDAWIRGCSRIGIDPWNLPSRRCSSTGRPRRRQSTRIRALDVITRAASRGRTHHALSDGHSCLRCCKQERRPASSPSSCDASAIREILDRMNDR